MVALKNQLQVRQRPRLRSWDEAFATLVSYRNRYGDCRVPGMWPKDLWLMKWVERVRAAKRQNLLTKDQIRELNQIGFTWKIVQSWSLWERRFKGLKAFQKKYGHCNVPRGYPPNRPLAYWVDHQRRSKRKGELDRESIRRLNELGFSWSLLHRRFHRRDLDEFVAFFTAFRKRHGHCDLLAAGEDVGLEIRWWVMDVRKSRKQGRLDPNYVGQLDRLGFLWEPRKQNWEDFCSALLKYRKRYGDCRVPSKWPENRSLAKWVERTRRRQKTKSADEGPIPRA